MGSTDDPTNFENDANAANAWKGTDPELRIDTVVDNDVKKAASSPLEVRASSETPPTQTSGRNKSSEAVEDATDYVPRWARSSRSKAYGDDDSDQHQDSSSDDEQFSPTDELPPFADEESKALHREIKLLEQRRDEAASAARSHKERVGVINDHLRSIRQEIDHTNSLVAAKKSEVDTEEHLLSLSQRELGQSLRDTSSIENGGVALQKTAKSVRSQIKVAEDELEKLRTDLNWNQEELEQWATAATKKEEESLALQKYTLADELKIKELTLAIEDLTKRSVEKKTLLENEVTETKSNQTELEKLAERFKNRHDERRELIRQWKDTIESMNNRDQTINELAGQYAGYAEKEDASKKSLYMNREQYELLENERDDAQQDIDDKERFLQTKRQDLSSLQDTEHSLRDEVDSLQRENSMVAAAVMNKKAEQKRAQEGLEQKRDHAGSLAKLLEDVKSKLANEKLDTTSKERVAERIEQTLAEREKELQQAEKNIASLKKKMYKDSQRLADLRKQEADLIADIHGTQANIKNYASKANELESKRTRQQELLYNADFQLQQMEKKVARGLGERSNEEQQELQSQVESLEAELEAEGKKKLLLVQQQRKLQAELRAWTRKHEATEAKHNDTLQRIDDIGLEIFACEQSLKEMVAKKEEAMVSHDVTLLDVRRLRDALRNLLEEVCALKQQHADASSSMQDKKEEKAGINEVKMAQLRASKEERHKSAIDLGKLKVSLDKTKAKYDMISAINAGKGEGEGYESPELKLILAAQKREELQQEGDKLDETIQKKEKEIRTMKKTLAQLRERNTNFRSSFARADMNGGKAQQLRELEDQAQSAEDTLVLVRKELQVLEKCRTEDQAKLTRMRGQLADNETKNGDLKKAKERHVSDVEGFKSKLDDAKKVVSAQSAGASSRAANLQQRAFHAELIELQANRIGQLLLNLGEEFPELRSDILQEVPRLGLSPVVCQNEHKGESL